MTDIHAMKAYKGGKTGQSGKNTDPNLLRVISEIEKETGKKVTPNESETRYSQMLLELIQPYQSDPLDPEELEDLLELATVAWNMANMKAVLPVAYKAMWEDVKRELGDDGDAKKLVEKMVKEKTKKFGGYDMFIHRAELKNSPQGFFVAATAKPLQDFMESALLDGDVQEDETDFNEEPGYINRNAFTLTAKQAFFDWLIEADAELRIPADMRESHVYLVKEKNSNAEVQAWVKKNYQIIFEGELNAWFIPDHLWPEQFSFELFNRWFDVSYQSMVFDMESYPVDKE